jgi:hypothetical protein
MPLNEPHVIHPRAVYTVASLQAALGLTKTTVAREVRLRRLRATRRAGRCYFLGGWVLRWLQDGELHRKEVNEVQAKNRA